MAKTFNLGNSSSAVDLNVANGGITASGDIKQGTTKVSLEGHTHSQYLTEHQTLKTINGQSIVGSGNISISGGSSESDIGGWTQMSITTNTTSASIDTSAYTELLIVADILRNSAHHICSATIPTGCVWAESSELKLTGGYGSAGANIGCWCSISTTSFAGVASYINGTSFLSSTTWKVYGRTPAGESQLIANTATTEETLNYLNVSVLDLTTETF